MPANEEEKEPEKAKDQNEKEPQIDPKEDPEAASAPENSENEHVEAKEQEEEVIEGGEEGEEEEKQEEIEEKAKESDRRMRGAYPWMAPVQAPAPTPSPMPVAPQPPRWYNDDELRIMARDQLATPEAIDAHRKQRDAFMIKEAAKSEIRDEYYAQRDWESLVEEFPALENPKSRLYQEYQMALSFDKNLANSPYGHVYAASRAIAKTLRGRLEFEKNKGRGEVMRDRRILNQVKVEKQTPPAKTQTKKKFEMSDEERMHAKQIGLTDEQWVSKRERLMARKEPFIFK